MDTDSEGKAFYRQKRFQDLSPADVTSVAGVLIGNMDVFHKLVQIVCHNGGYPITDDELNQCVLTLDETQTIILKSLSQGGKLQYKIATTVLDLLNEGDALVDELISQVAGQQEIEPDTAGSLARQVLDGPAQTPQEKGSPCWQKSYCRYPIASSLLASWNPVSTG